MDIAVRLVEHHVWLVGDLIHRAAPLDERTLDAALPTSADQFYEDPTIRSLLTTLVGQLETWLAVVEGKQSPEIPPESVEELRQRHGEAGRRFIELARRVVREGIAEDTFRDGTAEHPDVFTYGGVIAHVLTFAAHLRALAISAMQAAGIEDLRYGDPMLFLAELPASDHLDTKISGLFASDRIPRLR